ncbi:hypothetical protein [Hanstruepera ponticola]|uniref:hypothetical protein n=1 Tax=Hanstruepera ponticola TaxID=2042995 RepID=UPI000CF0E34C|nr:hypothetical protein [Hanstruepera ponticola]
MKNILFYFFIILTFSVKAQDSYFEIVKPRIEVIQKEKNVLNTDNYIALTNDTLYIPIKSEPNLDFVKSSYDRRKLVYNYEAQVFRLTTEKSKTTYRLKQWSVPIIVYFDKKISKEVKNDFIIFFSQINDIRNLNFSFTSKINEANYYIKSTNETINSYGDDNEFETKEELLNSTHFAGTYLIITDETDKFIGGVMKLNLDDMPNQEKLLRQIKQLFFMSLGNFYLSSHYPEDSILSKNYNNSNDLSKNDLDILKMHYSIIYDQKINGTIFNRLQKLQKRQ